MRGITCILDACTVINLLHIDEDETLVKKLASVDYFLCETVMREIGDNVFKKFDKHVALSAEHESRRLKRKQIETSLTQFRARVYGNERVLTEMGADFFESVKQVSGYEKDNGEFRSAALALCLSRNRPSDVHEGRYSEVKLFFHTDDSPAKEEFEKFYRLQQIGSIEDTVDLLILLHRLEGDTFNRTALDRALRDLQAQYASEVTSLTARLRELLENGSTEEQRDANFKGAVQGILSLLIAGRYEALKDKREALLRQGKKFSRVTALLDEHAAIFELKDSDVGLFSKIKEARDYIPKLHKLL
jgi:hypothetical protein